MTTTPSSSPADPDDPDNPATQGPPPLPAGWGELRTGDGRPYYVYYPTGAVQWERPKPSAADSDGSDEAEQQREEGSSAATAEGAAAAGGAAAVGGEAGARGEAGKGGAAVAGYGEEDPYRGEVRREPVLAVIQPFAVVEDGVGMIHPPLPCVL